MCIEYRQHNNNRISPATSPQDEFAESHANYIHTMTLLHPWTVNIYEDSKPVYTQPHC